MMSDEIALNSGSARLFHLRLKAADKPGKDLPVALRFVAAGFVSALSLPAFR